MRTDQWQRSPGGEPFGASSPDRRPQASRPVLRDAGALREASVRGRICAAMTNLPADAGKAIGGS